MQTLSEIRAMLAARGLRPRRRFGQNFLHDKNQLAKLVNAAKAGPGDVVLEIGPGTGTLTETLLEAGAEVVACEIDRDLVALVRERFSAAIETGRLRLIEGDCLDGKHALNPAILEALDGRVFVLAANLPYQVASPLMLNLALDHGVEGGGVRGCRGQFVTIQKEVADRLLAEPGSKEYGPLGIILRATSQVERLATLTPGCFWPAPQVMSAMIAITPRAEPLTDDPRAFALFIHRLFGRRRKQIGAIMREMRFWPAGIEPDARPEQLSIERLIALHQASEGAV